MATPIVKIASLEIDTDQVLQESAKLKANIDNLKAANKELVDSGQGSSVQFQKNAAEIKNLSKEYNDNQKLAASLIASGKDIAAIMDAEGKSVQQLRNDRAKLQQIGKNIVGSTDEEIEARNKLNKAIDAQTEIIKSDASPAYIQQADNIGNYISAQTGLNSVITQGNNVLNVAKGIYTGFAPSVSSAASQIKNAAANTEGMTTAQKSATVATNVLSGAMKILKYAIAATGIGLIVIALVSLISYFTKTQKGADEVSKVFEALGAVVDVLIDRVSSFGGALVKFFSGDFKGGFDDIKASLSGVGDEMIREASLAYELEAAFQAVEDKEIGLISKQAERKKQMEELRLAAKDEATDLKTRAELLEQAGEIEKQSLSDELEIAKERARISAERLALGESTREEIKADAELQAKVIELETQSLKLQRSIETERQSLLKRSASEAASLRTARVQAEIKAYNTELEIFKTVNAEKLENNVNTLQELRDKELELIQKKIDSGVLKEREGVLARLQIENEYLEAKAEIDNAELERVQSFEEQKKALEDEIRLAKAETEREAEEIRIEQEYEAHLLELENMELRETEKTELLKLLEEQKQLALNEIAKTYGDEALQDQKDRVAAEKALEEERVKNRTESLNAIIGLAGEETAVGKAALIAKQILAASEQAIDLGLFTSKAALKLGEATVDISAGTAKSAAAAPFPANLPLIAGFIGSVAGVLSSIKSATSFATSSASESTITAANGAYLYGPSHAGGGIDVNAEGGEVIINKRSTAAYLPVLSAINEAGGGVSFGGASSSSTGIIDYDVLAAKVAQANSALPSPVVSVEEFNTVSDRVSVVENSKEF